MVSNARCNPEMATRILITGFGAYGDGSNASQSLLDALRQSDDLEQEIGAELRFAELPVDTDAIEGILDALIETSAPTCCVFFGQAPGRNRVTPERIATNLRDFSVPDAGGRQPRGEPVVPGGPAAYRATLPQLDRAIAALNEAGIPAALSNTCGNHLCNQTLYLALHMAARRGLDLRAGFIHIPVTPEQVIAEEPLTLRHPHCPFMTTAMAVRAARSLLRHLASTPAESGEVGVPTA